MFSSSPITLVQGVFVLRLSYHYLSPSWTRGSSGLTWPPVETRYVESTYLPAPFEAFFLGTRLKMPEPTKKGRSVDSEDGISMFPWAVTTHGSWFMCFIRLTCSTVACWDQLCLLSLFEVSRVSCFSLQRASSHYDSSASLFVGILKVTLTWYCITDACVILSSRGGVQEKIRALWTDTIVTGVGIDPIDLMGMEFCMI